MERRSGEIIGFPAPVAKLAAFEPEALPPFLGALLYLTTRRCPADNTRWAPLRQVIAVMAGQGWRIRQAERRNHLMWRAGATMRFSGYRIVVLPVERGRLSPRHFDVFILGELIRAAFRVANPHPIDEKLASAFRDAIARLMPPHHSLGFEAIYLMAEEKFLFG